MFKNTLCTAVLFICHVFCFDLESDKRAQLQCVSLGKKLSLKSPVAIRKPCSAKFFQRGTSLIMNISHPNGEDSKILPDFRRPNYNFEDLRHHLRRTELSESSFQSKIDSPTVYSSSIHTQSMKHTADQSPALNVHPTKEKSFEFRDQLNSSIQNQQTGQTANNETSKPDSSLPMLGYNTPGFRASDVITHRGFLSYDNNLNRDDIWRLPVLAEQNGLVGQKVFGESRLNKFQYSSDPTVGIPCFEFIPQKVLHGHAQVLMKSTSLETCQRECLIARDFFCLSISYFRKEQKCLLNRQNALQQPKWFRSSKGDGEYYENKCSSSSLESSDSFIRDSPKKSLVTTSFPMPNSRILLPSSNHVPDHLQFEGFHESGPIFSETRDIVGATEQDLNLKSVKTNSHTLISADQWFPWKRHYYLRDSDFKPENSVLNFFRKNNEAAYAKLTKITYNYLEAEKKQKNVTDSVIPTEKDINFDESEVIKSRLNNQIDMFNNRRKRNNVFLEDILDGSCEDICRHSFFSMGAKPSLACIGSIKLADLGGSYSFVHQTDVKKIGDLLMEENILYKCEDEACGDNNYCCCL